MIDFGLAAARHAMKQDGVKTCGFLNARTSADKLIGRQHTEDR